MLQWVNQQAFTEGGRSTCHAKKQKRKILNCRVSPFRRDRMLKQSLLNNVIMGYGTYANGFMQVEEVGS